MRIAFQLVLSFFAFSFCNTQLWSDGAPQDEEEFPIQALTQEKSFTGKVTRGRVRLRLNPSTDSPVVREMDKGDMLMIIDEVEDFYAVKPPSDMKAYLYRTYVLDGVVEGDKVNVRINPHLEAPVVAQLNSGEQIEGKISKKNSKWLEIKPPASTLLYISSNYIEKVGDANYLAQYEARKEKVNNLLQSTCILSETELTKHFSEMEPDVIVGNYEKIIKEFNDFSEQVAEAKTHLASFNESFLRKKIHYLESKTQNTPDHWVEEYSHRSEIDDGRPLAEAPKAGHRPMQIYETWAKATVASEVNTHMALWMPVEITYYEEWAEKNDNRPIKDFYKEQKSRSVALKGILEPYNRPVRNKPGDYLLVNRTNRLPIAYLYSTHVNLQDKLGQEVAIEGLLRPNNNFAFPAYFVINAE